MPEARVRVDILVIRRAHKYLDGHKLSVPVEFVRNYLADLQSPEVDRRAGIDRTQIEGPQNEKAAGVFAAYDWRRFERHEVALFALRLSDFHADVGPGDEGAQPAHIGARYSRPYDPELGVLDQKFVGLGGHLCRGDGV